MTDTIGSETEVDTSTFALEVEPLRQEVNAVLEVEAAQDGLLYSDDGITTLDGDTWNATVWRQGDGGSSIEINCTRDPQGRWQVAMVPLSPERAMYVLQWPSPQFQVTLRAAVSDLG